MTTETRVNTFSTGPQTRPTVTSLADGGWLVTWTSYYQDGDNGGVYQQRYSASGAAVGSETRVNTTTKYGQSNSSVTTLNDGGWLVTWASGGQDGDNSFATNVYQQRFDAAGNKVAGETLVNTATTGYQQNASVIALPDGGWIVAFETGDGSVDRTLHQQRFDDHGNKIGSETSINPHTNGLANQPMSAALADGGWVVVFDNFEGGAQDHDVYQRRYDSAGNAVTNETLLYPDTTGTREGAAVTGLADGGWLVTWTHSDRVGFPYAYDIHQLRFAANGSPVGVETIVNTTTLHDQWFSAATALDDGGWVVVWLSGNSDADSILSQRYAADGLPVGGETHVNATTTTQLSLPSITGLDDGGWLVTWTATTSDGYSDIYQQRYDKYGNAVDAVVTTPPADITGALKWTEGKSGAVGTLAATDADDTTGFTWALVDDAGGRFAIDATTGKVTVAKPVLLDFEQATSHNITVKVTDNDGNSFTKVLTATGADVAKENLKGSASADKLWGGSKVDKFDGSKGDDTIRGGGGEDVLDGGKGKDTADYSDKTKSIEVTLNKAKAVTVEVGSKAEDSIKNFENVIGGSKADTLTGDSASNTFHGGKGKDVLDGKGGKDFFVFDTQLGNKHVDTIEGFTAKDDTIVLDHAIFTALAVGTLSADAFLANKTGNAADDGDCIIYDKKTGKLFYDADGSGAGAHQLFAVLDGHPKITAADFTIV